MRWLLILACSMFPFYLSAQLVGPYATTFNGNGALVLEFTQDNSFKYKLINRRAGEKGRGKFLLKEDTLTFQFIPFLDSGRVNCSFHRIKKDSGKIAERLVDIPIDTTDKEAKLPKDSMWVEFYVHDCQTGLPLEEVSVEVINKKGTYKLGKTDTAGLLKVKLTHNVEKKYRLVTVHPKYHNFEFNFIFDWNSKVEVFAYQSETTVLEEGITKSFRVNSYSSKYLDITPIPTDNKSPIYLRRGRNLSKINKLEYKAYQKALDKGEVPGSGTEKANKKPASPDDVAEKKKEESTGEKK